jgi:hypothetical protein
MKAFIRKYLTPIQIVVILLGMYVMWECIYKSLGI